MRLNIPTGLTAVMATLDHAITSLHSLGPDAEDLIHTSFSVKLATEQARLGQCRTRYAELKHAWNQALNLRDLHLATLIRQVRDAWQMLRRRDRRERLAGGLITLYRCPDLAPPHASATLWLRYARNLVEGEAMARAAGHAPMAFPSAAELAETLELSERAESSYGLLCLQLKQAESELRQQQRLCVHLLRCLAARLRESQFEQPPAQTRNLLRCFGFRFKTTSSDDAETRAELDQPELVPALVASCPNSNLEPAQAESAAQPAPVVPFPKLEGTRTRPGNWVKDLMTWVRPPRAELPQSRASG